MKQTQALDVMKLGHNVFLTGEPGSGKTHTLRRFINYCRNHDITVGVTASTGIAATHLDGMTIHSWSGIGIEDQMSEEQIQRLVGKDRLNRRFQKTRALIIDEVSMLDNRRLNLINQVLKAARSNHKPFGGLQVILCGDLFQLPPVSLDAEDADYPHRSQAWDRLDLKVCYLSEQHRQNRAQGQDMLDLLREIRARNVSQASIEALEGRQKSVEAAVDTTRLFTHNVDVNSLNQAKLAELEGESKSFPMDTDGQSRFVNQLKRSCLAPETLRLKEGAQVICIANNPAQGFVNGSRGEIVGFEDGQPQVKLRNGRTITLGRHTWSIEEGQKTLAELTQFPLRLAWAITVHKSQGMSLDEAEVDLSRSFAPGMGYVALSRLRSLSGLYLKGINNLALEVNPEISQFDNHLKQQSEFVVDSLLNLDQNQFKKLHKHVRTNLSLDYAEYDQELFERLKQWRTQQAEAEAVSAYRVLHDKTLLAVAAELPENEADLRAVPGIGDKKMEQYGPDLLGMVKRNAGKLV